ncbi:hypothetical protein VTN77DRAFT_2223 [Rasamsonia byssochlamydoides]|uniref:uncharacterized protein n=1 Tax=Rasamsonia byssochlamydoides TaxID=89139 RepID=UPI0037436D8A
MRTILVLYESIVITICSQQHSSQQCGRWNSITSSCHSSQSSRLINDIYCHDLAKIMEIEMPRPAGILRMLFFPTTSDLAERRLKSSLLRLPDSYHSQ